MPTRVFRARSLADARQAATAALGSDAVVLTTREVRRNGLLGFLGAKEIEVAAASAPAPEPASASPRTAFATGAYAREASPSWSQEPASRAAVVNALRSDLRSEIRAVKMALGRSAMRPSAAEPDLAAEIAAMREAIEQMAPAAPRGKRTAALLHSRAIEGRAATALARAMKASPSGSLEEQLREALTGLLSGVAWPLPARGERAVLAAVGLSGVGKTTTLAKLATAARQRGLRVALVTCDTFRVGAIEQMKRYAALLDVPFEVTRTGAALEAFLAQSTADLIIVDTSGRPPGDDSAERLLSPAAFEGSEACAPFQRHVLLCIPAASRDGDVARAMRSFEAAGATALAITKLDETSFPSGVVHAAVSTRLPIAVTCAGPRVPEDVAPTDIDDLVERIVPRTQTSKARAA